MATVFSILCDAFRPLRTPKSLQLPFWCLVCVEFRETSSPDFIQDEPPPPEGLPLFLFFTCLFSTKSLFPFLLPASYCLDVTLLLHSHFIWTAQPKDGVNKGFISACPAWLLVGKKFPVLSCLPSPCSIPVPDTGEATASFISTAKSRLSRDSAAMKSSKVDRSWKLEKKHSWLRILKFKMWSGRKVNEPRHLFF